MSGFRGPRGEGRYGVILGAHCPAPSRAQPNIAAHHTTVQAACRQAGWSRHHLGFGLGRRALLRRLATHAIGQLQHLPAGHSRMVGPHTAGHDLLVQLGAGWCREQLCPSATQIGRQAVSPAMPCHSLCSVQAVCFCRRSRRRPLAQVDHSQAGALQLQAKQAGKAGGQWEHGEQRQVQPCCWPGDAPHRQRRCARGADHRSSPRSGARSSSGAQYSSTPGRPHWEPP